MKYLKIVFKIIIGILITVLLLFILNYLRLIIDFQTHKNNYQEVFTIPGNTKNYVPQGMAYDENSNIVLQTSYNADGDVSKLYVTDFKTKKLIKDLNLYRHNSTIDTRHVGGIATDGKTVWITSDYLVTEYSLSEILNTDKTFIKSLKDTKLPIRGDFSYCDGKELWIGDFYLKPFYPVPNDTPLLFNYNLDNLDYNKPQKIISLPKMIQGMIITDKNEFIFTRSFTYLIRSSLTTYKNVLMKNSDTYNLNGNKIPYYHFTEKDIISEEKIPTMAEGIFYKDNSIYILFESSSNHYTFAYPKVNKVLKKVLDN